MNIPTLLLLESSAETCSVALVRNNKVVASKKIVEPNSHSKYLSVLVEEMVRESEIEFNQINAVVVSAGPGSYTGLRIGASLAKGICFGLAIPLISASTLKAIAYAAQSDGTNYYLATVDARRDDAYIALFNQDFEVVIEEKFATIDQELITELSAYQGIKIVGNASQKFSKYIKDLSAEIVEGVTVLAEHLLPESLEKLMNQNFEDLTYFEPNYIKAVHVSKPKTKI